MRVIIDYGNYDIKVYSNEKGSFKFSSKCHNNFEANPGAFERIEFKNEITFIGVGSINQEYVKVNKDFIVQQVLYAISQATGMSNVDLALLLPINQLPQSKSLIDKFKGTCYEFTVNNKFRSIFIDKVCVLPECAVSINMLHNQEGHHLLIDIGSRTTQFSMFKDGHMVRNGTEKIGIINLYEEIMNRANAQGECYELEDIEDQIKRGKIVVESIVYENFLKQVLNKIKTKVTLSNNEVTFIGGGSLVLKDIIEKIPDVKVLDNAVYSNVLGAKEIIDRMWGYGNTL